MIPISESTVQANIVLSLRLLGYLVHFCGAERARHPRQIRNRAEQGTLVGFPDLCVLGPDGLVVWLEVKSPKGRVTAVQRQVHKHMAKLGHTVHVVRNWPDVKEAMGL